MRAVGKRDEDDRPEQEQVDHDEPLVHPLDQLEPSPVGQPVHADDGEAERERVEAWRELEQGVGDGLRGGVAGQVRDAEVDDKERDRDGVDRVAEEDDPLERRGVRALVELDGFVGRRRRHRPILVGRRGACKALVQRAYDSRPRRTGHGGSDMDDLTKLVSDMGGEITADGAADPAAALSGLQSAVQREGGIDGLMSKLRAGGLGEQVDSWVSTGSNAPVAAGPARAGARAGHCAAPVGRLRPERRASCCRCWPPSCPRSSTCSRPRATCRAAG